MDANDKQIIMAVITFIAFASAFIVVFGAHTLSEKLRESSNRGEDDIVQRRIKRMRAELSESLNEPIHHYDNFMFTHYGEVVTTEIVTLPEKRKQVADAQAAPERWMLTDDGEILEIVDK